MTENERHIVEQDKIKTKVFLLVLPFYLCLMAAVLFSNIFIRSYDEYKYYGYDPNADPVPHMTTLSDVCIYGAVAFAAIAVTIIIIALWIRNIRKTDHKAKTAIILLITLLTPVFLVLIYFIFF